MRTQNFYQLSRAAQDRFIDTALRRTVPKPILSRACLRPFPWLWAAATSAGLCAFVILIGWGYGRLDTPFAIVPRWMYGVYALVASLTCYCLLQSVARLSESQHAPFPHGKFIYPAALIDASRPNFGIWPLSDLQSVDLAGHTVALRFSDGTTAKFRARDDAAAQQARERILEAKRELLEATLQDQDLSALDPLLEPRYSNPLAPLAPLAPRAPRWRKFSPVFALLAGVTLALVVGFVRNTLSERRMFAVAVETNTPESYRGYLEHGGARPQVRELLLPSAEFEAIKRTGSLEALEAYARDNPDSKIHGAVQLALREALLRALDEARKAETLAALDAFARTHPSQALVQAEVKAARQALMKRVLTNFRENHASKEADLIPFVEQLLEHLAVHGPRVEVRFHRIVPDSVERADKAVRRDKYFIASMLPSRYFDDEHSQKREELIFGHLAERFRDAFSADALELVHGAHLTSSDKLPEQPDVPTLFISHSTNMGQGIGNLNPNGTFVGVGFLFKAQFVIPGVEQTLQMKYSTWRPPDLLELRKGKITIPGVYLTMADTAFGSFDERLVRWLFRK